MNLLRPYVAPSWASTLKILPNNFIELAHRNTPIQEWPLRGVPNGFQISLKRDDLTGSVLSGNKVRKLEFLLADALEKKCDSVVTCGGIQSNHCRATAISARSVGLNTHLLLRTAEPETDANNCFGNVLLDRMTGAQVYLVPKESLAGGLSARIDKLIKRLWDSKKEHAYNITLGGSSPLGTFGYIEQFEEMIKQGVLENFTDLVLAVGSGGTVGGLAIANYLTGSQLKVHGVCVCDSAEYFYHHVDELIKDYGLGGIKAKDICDLVDGYKGIGYAKSTDEELELLVNIAQSTGVMLDPVYTLKAARGMLKEIEFNPSRFKGKQVLFLHTGGFFALFDGRINNVLLQKDTTKNKDFKIWTDAASDPLDK